MNPKCDIPGCGRNALSTSIFCGPHENAGENKPMSNEQPKEKRWCDPVDGVIHIPDEHDSLINSIAFQHKLHSVSGSFGENEMYARMAYVAEKHFKKLYIEDKLTPFNEQPKDQSAEEIFRKYSGITYKGYPYTDRIIKGMEEYADQEIVKVVAEKDAEINNLEMHYHAAKLEIKDLQDKISILEANVLASVARDEAAEKMAEALDKIKQAFKIIGNDSVVELCGTALSSWNAAKEGGNNEPR